MPQPNPVPFPTEAFERVSRMSKGELAVDVYDHIRGQCSRDNSMLLDSLKCIGWMVAAVPRIRERNRLLRVSVSPMQRDILDANLADLGVMP